MNFRESLAAYVLGAVTGDELPRICTDAMIEGCESSSLAALAGESRRLYDPIAFGQLLRAALRELSMTLPSVDEAARTLIGYYVRAVSEGQVAPRDGARRVVWIQQQVAHEVPDRDVVGDGLGVERLIGLYYSHDDCGHGSAADHEEIDREILAEFRRLQSA